MEAGSTQTDRPSIAATLPYVLRRVVMRSPSGRHAVFYLVLAEGKVVKSFPGGAGRRAERYVAQLLAEVAR